MEIEHVAASAGSAALRRFGEGRLKPGLRTRVSERPDYAAALDIETVDPRAGGYAWTAVDGSVAIAAASVWHNTINPYDVAGDGVVTSLDALAAGSCLNSPSVDVALTPAPLVTAYHSEVNDDRSCAALDILMVINHLNAREPSSDRVRDRLFGDLTTDLLPLETVLADLVGDVASAWRRGRRAFQ